MWTWSRYDSKRDVHGRAGHGAEREHRSDPAARGEQFDGGPGHVARHHVDAAQRRTEDPGGHRRRQSVEHGGERVDEGERWLCSLLGDELTDGCHGSAGVGDADREGEAGRCEVVAGGLRVIGVADVDRHREPDVLGRGPHLLVVVPEPSRRGGEERVVEAAPCRLGRGLRFGERQGDGVEVHRERPPGHGRGEGYVGRCAEAGDGRGRLTESAGGAHRVGRGGDGRGCGHRGKPLGDAEASAALVVERVDESLELAHHRHLGGGGELGERGFALELEQHHGDLHRAHAVGDGVMDLHDQRGAAVGEVGDRDGLPERSGPVEALHRHGLGQVEHGALVAVACGSHPAEVVVEVEVRVHLPAWWRDRVRIAPHPLAHAGHQPGAALEQVAEALLVGGPVEEEHRSDGRAQQRVLLDGPHERVGVGHAVLEAQLTHVGLPAVP
jgi:hypothetical protein